ncbi:RluA family pseudouridine synthase [Defluviitalea saccharophila]|uniref:Pseudouridine synthase n=1 Tax=Defluviitalea saccharophila TaxID=879970 RepID=A0ABZ2Y7J9_9FIRM
MDFYTYIVESEDAGKRVDVFLTNELEEVSRSFIQKLISDEKIKVNQKTIKSNYKLRLDDIIDVEIPDPEPVEILAEPIPLDILYEDKDIIVVNKPQGMVVHPAPGHYTGTLVNALLYHCKEDLSGINGLLRPGIVHRIDKDTSGVLMVAKNDYAHNHLALQLKEHSITRKYNAIVYHNIVNDEGTINAPIGRHPTERKKMAVTQKNSRHAITHYTVLERFGQFTLIEAQLETGRTHQIRVHMKHIGHPLLGDPVYGPKSQPYNINGQMLHARVLGFIHPSKKEYMEFEAPIPKYFMDVIEKLRKNAHL